MTFRYIWPIGLVVLSNIIYHICSKSVPGNLDPFASLTVTYLVGALCSCVLYFAFSRGGNLIAEFGKLNFAPFLLGIAIVGLEAGFTFAYRNGWQVSTATLVQSSVLTVALIFVGFLLFQEKITWNKLVGIGICLIGLVFINYKK